MIKSSHNYDNSVHKAQWAAAWGAINSASTCAGGILGRASKGEGVSLGSLHKHNLPKENSRKGKEG
jgi:hypothetical protein